MEFNIVGLIVFFAFLISHFIEKKYNKDSDGWAVLAVLVSIFWIRANILWK